MHKVINFQDKIQSINDKKNELDAKRKKVLNKRTTFKFNYYELYVLIMELSENLLYYEDLARDIMEDEGDDDSLRLFSYCASQITRLSKKFYKMYLNNNCFSDSKIQLTLDDIEICMDALELSCESKIDMNYRNCTCKDEYEKLNKYYKTAFYLYTIFKNERKSIIEKSEFLRRQTLSKKERKRLEELGEGSESVVKCYEAKDMLCNIYKNRYIEEYRSKIQFIYESTIYLGDHAICSTYFVKGNTKFNKFMSKYHYHRESKNFVYYYDWDIKEQKEMGPEINYFPVGWRFYTNVPKEEEYEEEVYESDKYEDYIEYEDYVLLKLDDKIKNSEEMQNFKFEIINYDKKQEIYSDFDILNEHLLDKFEEVSDIYCGINNIIHPDGRIGYEFDKILLLNYGEEL